MLKYFDKDVNKIVQAVAKADEEKKSTDSSSVQKEKSTKEDTSSQKSGESEEVSPQPEQKPVKQKKEFKIRVEEDAPNQEKK
jgi:hypothetical protein